MLFQETSFSNYGKPTEKVSEYLVHILKSVMQEKWSYTKDFGYFLKKLVKILEGVIFTKADVVGLSLSLVVGSQHTSWDRFRSTQKKT